MQNLGSKMLCKNDGTKVPNWIPTLLKPIEHLIKNKVEQKGAKIDPEIRASPALTHEQWTNKNPSRTARGGILRDTYNSAITL